jgi:lipid-A-disaccharide synthase
VLAGRFVVPELMQEDATPENLAQVALNLFDDTVARHAIERVFAGLARDLAADTGALAAEAVAQELGLAAA